MQVILKWECKCEFMSLHCQWYGSSMMNSSIVILFVQKWLELRCKMMIMFFSIFQRKKTSQSFSLRRGHALMIYIFFINNRLERTFLNCLVIIISKNLLCTVSDKSSTIIQLWYQLPWIGWITEYYYFYFCYFGGSFLVLCDLNS